MKLELEKNLGKFLDKNPIPDKTIKILADSIYQTLKNEGCKNKDIIGISSQLIGMVTESLGNSKPDIAERK